MSGFFAALGIVHTLVAAAIVVGYALSLSHKAPTALLLWSARAQLVLGLVLVGLAEGGDLRNLNHSWVAVKLLVALGVVACVEISRARARKDRPAPALLHGALVLTLVNVVVAFLRWS